MTVQELIDKLSLIPKAKRDQRVLMSRDEEGNGYHEIEEVNEDWEDDGIVVLFPGFREYEEPTDCAEYVSGS